MTSVPASPVRRVESIDVLRGVVMILMALDHVRDYFGAAGINPTDPATTTVPLFFTRWITHFCAPTFFFLTGMSAYRSGQRRGAASQSRHLLVRGFWLILLELVILRCLAWQWNFDFRVNLFAILWALGWSMIALAALVRFSLRTIAIFGAALVLGHNLLDGINAASLGALAPVWLIFHQQGLLIPAPGYFILVAYPIIPWIGVTAAGYAMGQVLDWDPARRRAFLFRLGLGLTVAFLVFRWINVYGDPRPWSPQRSPVFTLLSYLNTTKYPPSLFFLMMTLGPALLMLRAVDGGVPRWLRPAEVLGRVPLFYYIMHVLVIHLLVLIVVWYRYGEIHWVFESPTPDKYPFTQPPGWPFQLPVVYGIWILVVVTLWPMCRWFAGIRARRRDWWLSYL